MTTEKSNGWNEWSRFVLKELERLNENMEKLDGKIDELSDKLLILKVKSGLIGGIAGMIPSLFVVVLYLVFKK